MVHPAIKCSVGFVLDVRQTHFLIPAEELAATAFRYEKMRAIISLYHKKKPSLFIFSELYRYARGIS